MAFRQLRNTPPAPTEAQDPEADFLPPVTGADVDVAALTLLLAVNRVADRRLLAADRAVNRLPAVDHAVDRLPVVILRIVVGLTTAAEVEEVVEVVAVEVTTIRTPRHNATVGNRR